MTRRPNDAMSQRQLVYELRMAIDRAVRTDRWTRVDALLDANPHSAFSHHVTQNIGARRAVWLADHARRRDSSASLRRTTR